MIQISYFLLLPPSFHSVEQTRAKAFGRSIHFITPQGPSTMAIRIASCKL